MPLTSAKDEYSPDIGSIRFLMQDGNTQVPCRISHEALTDRGSKTRMSGTQVFEAYRPEIEQAASDLYDRGKIDAEGRVWVTTAEFPAQPK
jgi:hypothetical protein